MNLVPKSECIYVRCRAVNLCKGEYCVGADLKEQGYIFENGEIKQVPKERSYNG